MMRASAPVTADAPALPAGVAAVRPAPPLVRARAVGRDFAGRRAGFGRAPPVVRALCDVSVDVAPGEVVGVVGESGSGKSTLGRVLLRLIAPTAGQVQFGGTDITSMTVEQLRPLRRDMQMIFQDPYSSLNPRMSIRETLAEAMTTHRAFPRSELDDRIAVLLARVGLAPEHMQRLPRAFSGGQRQRIAIARALAVEPRFVVADEPVSALDVSIQAEVIRLLAELQRADALAMLFISHDLSVIEAIADRVVVMYLGRVMEMAPASVLFSRPRHPYTRALLESVPRLGGRGRERRVLAGEIPSPTAPPSGCVFRTRCPHAMAGCGVEIPPLVEAEPGQFVACLRENASGEPQ